MTDVTAQIFAIVVALAIFSAIVDEEFFFSTLRFIRRGGAAADDEISLTARTHFQLLRYFTVVGLLTIGLVTATLAYFKNEQAHQMMASQARQSEILAASLKKLDQAFQENARHELLRLREAEHIRTARLIADTLGEDSLETLLGRSGQLPIEKCTALPAKDPNAEGPPLRQNCFAALASDLVTLPGQASLSARLAALVKQTGFAAARVVDPRGVTIAASDPADLGEELTEREHWEPVLTVGKPRSGLVSADPLQVIANKAEKRDLILTQVPLIAQKSARVIGLLEVTSDMTTELAELGKKRQRARTESAHDELAQHRVAIEEAMARSSSRALIIVAVLMLALFGALFALVRRADQLTRKREQAFVKAQSKLEEITLVANSNHLDPVMAGEIKVGLARVRQHLRNVEFSLSKSSVTLKLAEQVSAMIRRTPADQMVLNIGKVKTQLASAPDSTLNLADLQQHLDVAQSLLEQIDELIEGTSQPANFNPGKPD